MSAIFLFGGIRHLSHNKEGRWHRCRLQTTTCYGAAAEELIYSARLALKCVPSTVLRTEIDNRDIHVGVYPPVRPRMCVVINASTRSRRWAMSSTCSKHTGTTLVEYIHTSSWKSRPARGVGRFVGEARSANDKPNRSYRQEGENSTVEFANRTPWNNDLVNRHITDLFHAARSTTLTQQPVRKELHHGLPRCLLPVLLPDWTRRACIEQEKQLRRASKPTSVAVSRSCHSLDSRRGSTGTCGSKSRSRCPRSSSTKCSDTT